MTSSEFGTTSNLPIQIELPGYRLRRQIGADAVGLWFDAEQESLGRKLTVKVLKPRFQENEAAHREFLAEMDRLSGLDHPNLIRVIDSLRGPQLALITERIAHSTLARLLEDGKPHDPAQSMKYALGIARALRYLETRELAHKNLSPGLIVLREDGGCRLVTFRYIIPAGELAKLKGKLTQDARYVAPEQIGGPHPIGPMTFCYHVATLLFHMLAGRPPHSRGTTAETAKAHLLEPFPSLKTARPFLNEAIYNAVGACTVKNPAKRPDLGRLIEALQDLIAGRDPGLEPPPPEPQKPGKIIAPKPRRRRRRRR